MVTVTVSPTLRLAVWRKRAEGTKQWQLAKAANVHPSIFSALVNNLIPIQPNDGRVLRIADVLGVPRTEAFTAVREKGGHP